MTKTKLLLMAVTSSLALASLNTGAAAQRQSRVPVPTLKPNKAYVKVPNKKLCFYHRTHCVQTPHGMKCAVRKICQ